MSPPPSRSRSRPRSRVRTHRAIFTGSGLPESRARESLEEDRSRLGHLFRATLGSVTVVPPGDALARVLDARPGR